MTVSIRIEPQRHVFSIAHEAVCTGCGHGDSLHTQRDECLVCEQRGSAGLARRTCAGFRSDRRVLLA